MSDVSQGPGWWLASDGKWYPPESAPGYVQSPPPQQNPYGAPAVPGMYAPTPGPYMGGPAYMAVKTNGFAVASLVLGIVWIYWIGSILAIIFALIARKQIKERHQKGDGMAIAGLVLGIIWMVLLVIGIIADIAAHASRTY